MREALNASSKESRTPARRMRQLLDGPTGSLSPTQISDESLLQPLLSLQGLALRFDSVQVIQGLSLDVRQGEVLGVVGASRAARGTLLNLVTGALPASGGKVVFEGRDVTDLSAWQRCRMGIGRTDPTPAVFRNMTVFELVLVAAAHARALGLTEARRVALQSLALCGLSHCTNEFASKLALLELKKLEIARALAAQPRLLLLDEIADGLTAPACEQVLDIVRSLSRRGTTILWVAHAEHVLQQVANRVALLEGSAIAVQASQDALRSDARPSALCQR